MASKKSSKRRKSRPAGKKPSAALGYSVKAFGWLVILLAVLFAIGFWAYYRNHHSSLSSFQAQPYNVVHPLVRPNAKPSASVSPSGIKNVYGLPTGTTAGSGTIAIIDAYDDPSVESDLAVFDQQFGLPACTTANGCFTKVKMVSRLQVSADWAIEESLDVEWAHAMAPGAKVLLVEARSSNGVDLVNAINYARNLSNVVAVSMSWGGNEFSGETAYESDFISRYGATFFAASGDNGTGTSWPAVSVNVIGVGGTTVTLNSSGELLSETAWSGSGGGRSTYITEPAYQSTYGVPQATAKRATPDVSYDADPNSGFAVYDSTSYYCYRGWFQVGGTSAGTVQWAAIRALAGNSLSLSKLYQDAAPTNQTTLRDITAGTNGSCGYYCTAQTRYDYVTGLGSPLKATF